MVNENLLATYSLLSFIRDTYGSECNESLTQLFVPLIKETLNRMLRKKGTAIMGKDYSEIFDSVRENFQIEIPIPVITTLMPQVCKYSGGSFTLNSDHSFIIDSECTSTITEDYQNQKKLIKKLANNYKIYCKGRNVPYDFEELVTFIQDQKNRIFNDQSTAIYNQSYHVSKYVYDRIKKKDFYFDIICSIYLGGIISSYFKFKIKDRIIDTELLVDTNFYISLIELNTEESYAACKQLYDLTIAMGFRYSILETTVEQIRILLSSKVRQFKSKDLFATLDVADILSACGRRGLDRSFLEACKDNLKNDLSEKGISIVYNQNIRALYEKTGKSKDLQTLTNIRGNRESAFNDLLAQEYVAYKRKDKIIAEFNDVNCWFLNNFYSVNRKEKSLPVWQRISITASDLLVLLWLANPSLSIGNSKSMLAMTSLSANVIKYRSEHYPSHKVICKIQDRIARLQIENNISEASIAKLCIRMSEGEIDRNEADRLLTLSSPALLEYINRATKNEDIYLETSEKNEILSSENNSLKAQLEDKCIENKLMKMRVWGVAYAIIVTVVYWLGIKYVNPSPITWYEYLGHIIYWLVTTVCVNWYNHMYFVNGIISFFKRDLIIKKISENYPV